MKYKRIKVTMLRDQQVGNQINRQFHSAYKDWAFSHEALKESYKILFMVDSTWYRQKTDLHSRQYWPLHKNQQQPFRLGMPSWFQNQHKPSRTFHVSTKKLVSRIYKSWRHSFSSLTAVSESQHWTWCTKLLHFGASFRSEVEQRPKAAWPSGHSTSEPLRKGWNFESESLNNFTYRRLTRGSCFGFQTACYDQLDNTQWQMKNHYLLHYQHGSRFANPEENFVISIFSSLKKG